MEQYKKKSIGNLIIDRWRTVGFSALSTVGLIYTYFRARDVVDVAIEHWDQSLLLGGLACLSVVGAGKSFDHVFDKEKRQRKVFFRAGLALTTIGALTTLPQFTDTDRVQSPASSTPEDLIKSGTSRLENINGLEVRVFYVPDIEGVSCQDLPPRPVVQNESPWEIIRSQLAQDESVGLEDDSLAEDATIKLHSKNPNLFAANIFAGELISVVCVDS